MVHAMQQQKFTSPIKFKTFSKYDFVKSYAATAKDEKLKAEKEAEAAIIADAFEETQAVLLENLATKEDLKMLEISLKREMQGNLIKLGVLITVLLGVLPLVVGYLKPLFN